MLHVFVNYTDKTKAVQKFVRYVLQKIYICKCQVGLNAHERKLRKAGYLMFKNPVVVKI